MRDLRNVSLYDLENVTIGDVFLWDYPDFCDAFIEYAEMDGEPLTDVELSILTENCGDQVNEFAHEQLR